MIVAIVIASHVPVAAEYAHDHFFNGAEGVVVYRDDTTDLCGIEASVPVYLLDGGVVFRFPHVLGHLIEQGHALLSPRDAGVMV